MKDLVQATKSASSLCSLSLTLSLTFFSRSIANSWRWSLQIGWLTLGHQNPDNIKKMLILVNWLTHFLTLWHPQSLSLSLTISRSPVCSLTYAVVLESNNNHSLTHANTQLFALFHILASPTHSTTHLKKQTHSISHSSVFHRVLLLSLVNGRSLTSFT